jgi:hypothetical protein
VVRLVPAVLALVVLCLAGCGTGDGDDEASPPTPSPTAEPPAFLLDFESDLTVGTDAQRVENAGTGGVDVDVRTSGTAAIEVVEGPEGGHAIRFPAYTGAATAPAAVLVAADQSDGTLDPGDADFTFGASFSLDEKSSGSDADNGDNLVQRGTFDSPGQFKIQLDHGVPSCRILGDAGEVVVKAEGPVDPTSWYAVTCERTASEVTLQVKALDGGAGEGTWKKSGPTGALSFQGVPLTIGGKTGPDGTPVASADQFNGAVDDVFLSVE